ncbi:uncharacterized protein LOC108742416 [Agrilus planipennis]|uniref:Uncharacterized protein LOC108742416 n=1 Tax=Agrilus planipennis TaxID=224129 RepID=A0A7F5R8C3_AGRPL|nr:uncharacterized protein LOC108742416 [Agrilus planipennis]
MDDLEPVIENILLRKGFWMALDILIGNNSRKTERDVMRDVRCWVDKLMKKRNAKRIDHDAISETSRKNTNKLGDVNNLQERIKIFSKASSIYQVYFRFSQPNVKPQLEKLMGTKVISLTDRSFMIKLQERVLEEYKANMEQRIANRKKQELERIKGLVLVGIIPTSHAPSQMANHPVVVIEQYCNKLVKGKRKKIKKPSALIPQNLYYDEIPDLPFENSTEKAHALNSTTELCLCPFAFLESTDNDAFDNDMVLPQGEYDRLKYESDELKHLRRCKFRFSQPNVKPQLEKLMGTKVISLTDRSFMIKLQERVLEEYKANMEQRIANRKKQELERIKGLVLVGIIPTSHAPSQMANHPVVVIEQYCNKLVKGKRKKIKKPSALIPQNLYYDEIPDLPFENSTEKAHALNSTTELCLCPFAFLESTDNDAFDNDMVLPQGEYDRLKYESDELKHLRRCKTVEEMYRLADEIIGILYTV